MLIELIHITRNKNDIPLKLTKISPLLELNSSLPTHPLPLYPHPPTPTLSTQGSYIMGLWIRKLGSIECRTFSNYRDVFRTLSNAFVQMICYKKLNDIFINKVFVLFRRKCWIFSFILREKRPNTEFFLVCIFLYSVRIQEKTDQKKLRIWTLFRQCHVIQQTYESTLSNSSNSVVTPMMTFIMSFLRILVLKRNYCGFINISWPRNLKVIHISISIGIAS